MNNYEAKSHHAVVSGEGMMGANLMPLSQRGKVYEKLNSFCSFGGALPSYVPVPQYNRSLMLPLEIFTSKISGCFSSKTFMALYVKNFNVFFLSVLNIE